MSATSLPYKLCVCLDVYKMSAASLPYKLCVCVDLYTMSATSLPYSSVCVWMYTRCQLHHYLTSSVYVWMYTRCASLPYNLCVCLDVYKMCITALQALCMCGFIHDVSYITALQLSVCLDVYEMSAASLPYKLNLNGITLCFEGEHLVYIKTDTKLYHSNFHPL